MHIIIDPSPTLKAFLDARARGAPEEELKSLIAADEAARAHKWSLQELSNPR